MKESKPDWTAKVVAICTVLGTLIAGLTLWYKDGSGDTIGTQTTNGPESTQRVDTASSGSGDLSDGSGSTRVERTSRSGLVPFTLAPDDQVAGISEIRLTIVAVGTCPAIRFPGESVSCSAYAGTSNVIFETTYQGMRLSEKSQIVVKSGACYRVKPFISELRGLQLNTTVEEYYC
jgi:hypothetical protein